MEEVRNKVNTIFEISFEAGHKVGGIFTVLKSKSKEMKRIYEDNYVAIGFYDSKSALEHFEQEEAPSDYKKVFEELKNEGINAYYGRWVTANNIRLILLETKEFREKGIWFKKDNEMIIDRNVNLIKKRLWDDYGIDSLNTGMDYDEPLAWSYAAGKLVEKVCSQGRHGKAVAHFHEWLSGAGLLYLKKNYDKIGLVFTTHATRLGRALSSKRINVSEARINNYLKEASRLGIKAQHMLEKKCAESADAFTTVSDVVAEEATSILGVKPHIIMPNALEFSEYLTMEKVIAKRRVMRLKMKKFLLAYFSSYYTIKTSDCVIFYTLGRYEFYNKGINLYIDALGKLNKKLKGMKEGEYNPVYAFIWIPQKNEGVKEEIEENMLSFDRIDELINEEMGKIKENLLINSLEEKEMSLKFIFGEEFMNELRLASKSFLNMRKGEVPSLCAFKINEKNDMIMKHLKKNGLMNKANDPVKIIFYPEYLNPKDPILSMDVNDAVMSCTMGVFPSRYEPWGLTIMEAGALLALGVTTNSSGAGSFIQKIFKEVKKGLMVLDVKQKNDDQISNDLSEIMKGIVLMDKDSLLELSINARNIAEQLDWRIQINNYVKAYNMAVK